MAQETAVYRDDVEQVRRRWAEWRSTHAVRSRLPEELWAAAAGSEIQPIGLDAVEITLRRWRGSEYHESYRPERINFGQAGAAT